RRHVHFRLGGRVLACTTFCALGSATTTPRASRNSLVSVSAGRRLTSHSSAKMKTILASREVAIPPGGASPPRPQLNSAATRCAALRVQSRRGGARGRAARERLCPPRHHPPAPALALPAA